MKKIVILGAGTAGTIMANKLASALDHDEWAITIVDRDETHHYQPGYLFIPFGIYSPRDVVKPRRDYLPRGIDVVLEEIDVIEPNENRVRLKSGRTLGYDFLIVATGAHPEPGQTEGLNLTLEYRSFHWRGEMVRSGSPGVYDLASSASRRFFEDI
jgi:sulfide:quinone oxidoreductase